MPIHYALGNNASGSAGAIPNLGTFASMFSAIFPAKLSISEAPRRPF